MQNQKIHPQNAPQGETKETENQQKKYINTALYWLLMFVSFINAAQNTIYLTIYDSTLQNALIPSISVFSFIIFFLISYFYGPNKWQVFHLCVLFDNILVGTIIGLIGLAGFMHVMFGQGLPAYKVFFLFIMCLQYFFLGGVYRILLAWCYWKKWQVICCKGTLVLASCSYFYIALSLIISGLPESFAVPEEVSQKLVQLSFLYVFGLFSFYYEIFNKLTDLDGTAQLKHHYSILPKDQNEESPKENEKNNQTVFKINFQPNQPELIG